MMLRKMIAAVQSRFGAVAGQDRGATATEYGLLVAFIAIAIVVGITAFGTSLNNWFSNLAGLVQAL